MYETGKQMAEGIESTVNTASEAVQDLNDAIHDTLVATNLTLQKDGADQKYAATLTSISQEQGIALEDEVCSQLLSKGIGAPFVFELTMVTRFLAPNVWHTDAQACRIDATPAASS